MKVRSRTEREQHAYVKARRMWLIYIGFKWAVSYFHGESEVRLLQLRYKEMSDIGDSILYSSKFSE